MIMMSCSELLSESESALLAKYVNTCKGCDGALSVTHSSKKVEKDKPLETRTTQLSREGRNKLHAHTCR